MIPKEKALELQSKYYGYDGPELAIGMSLICVSEIIKTLKELDEYEHVPKSVIDAWEGVREELKKL